MTKEDFLALAKKKQEEARAVSHSSGITSEVIDAEAAMKAVEAGALWEDELVAEKGVDCLPKLTGIDARHDKTDFVASASGSGIETRQRALHLEFKDGLTGMFFVPEIKGQEMNLQPGNFLAIKATKVPANGVTIKLLGDKSKNSGKFLKTTYSKGGMLLRGSNNFMRNATNQELLMSAIKSESKAEAVEFNPKK